MNPIRENRTIFCTDLFQNVAHFVKPREILLWSGLGVTTTLLFRAVQGPRQWKRGALYGLVFIPAGQIVIPWFVKKSAKWLGLNQVKMKEIDNQEVVDLTQDDALYQATHQASIVGYSVLTTLSTILTFPLCRSPIIFVAQKVPEQNRWDFKKITLSEISNERFSKSTQCALQILRTLEILKTATHESEVQHQLAANSLAFLLADPITRSCFIKKFFLYTVVLVTLHYIGLCLKKRSLLRSDLEPIIELSKKRFKIPESLPESPPISNNNTQEILPISLPPVSLPEKTVPKITRQETLEVKQEPKILETINFEDSLGELYKLPVELQVKILNYLKPTELKTVANVSLACQALAKHLMINEKQKIYENYPEEIVDAIGWVKLALSPILDLKTTLARSIPKVSDEQLDNAINRYRMGAHWDNDQYAVFKKRIGLKSLQQIGMEYHIQILFRQNRIESAMTHGQEREWPFVHQKGVTTPNPLLYFIDLKEMGNDATIKRFVDAAGRHGIVFRLVGKAFINHSEISSEGVAILHQLHPKRKDWVWIENFPLSCYYLLSESDFSVDVSNSKIQRYVRFFPFLHFFKNKAGPECADNLKWLKKLASGERCGWLQHGKELDFSLPSFQLGRYRPVHHPLHDLVSFFKK